MNPKVITWARERADLTLDELASKRDFKRIREWEAGTVKPTAKQMDKFAKKVGVSDVYLYLCKEPPEELKEFGLEDFRTVGSKEISKFSPNMIDTISDHMSRKDWYHGYAATIQIKMPKFVGSARIARGHRKAAVAMAKVLKFGLGEQQQFRTAEDALSAFFEAARNAGILAMTCSVARRDKRRKLNPSEFRGFVISDIYAPLVFINAEDSVPAQMFTLAHELAHLWLGDKGVCSVEHEHFGKYDSKNENWCNQVAAEFLVPMERLSDIDVSGDDWYDNIVKKAKSLKVSKDIVFLRLLDNGHIDREYSDFACRHDDSAPKKRRRRRGQSETELLLSELGSNFATWLAVDGLAGRTLITDAHELLGRCKSSTMHELERIRRPGAPCWPRE